MAVLRATSRAHAPPGLPRQHVPGNRAGQEGEDEETVTVQLPVPEATLSGRQLLQEVLGATKSYPTEKAFAKWSS